MKVSILVFVLAVGITPLLRAQEKSPEENEKQQVKIRLKTAEEVDEERTAERKKYQANQQAFTSKTVPLAEELLSRNRHYYQSLHRNLKVNKNIVLQSLSLNQMSRVELAAEGEALVALTPTNVNNARLSYHAADGQLKWEKQLRFADLSRSTLALKVSADGRRVMVSKIADETLSTVAIYDQSGKQIPGSGMAGSLYMAPSGNYFYRADEGYWGYPQLYGATLSPRDLVLDNFLRQDHSQYEYRYRYRIFDDDLLVLLVIEYRRPGEAPPDSTGNRKKRALRKSGKPKLNRQMLYVYNLNEESVIFRKDLMLSKHEGYRVSFSDGRMNIKNSRLVSSFLRGPGKGIDLLIADLTTPSARSHFFDTIDFSSFSADGSLLWINNLVQRNGSEIINQYSILDLTTDQFLAYGKEFRRDEGIVYPGLIKSFFIQDNRTILLFYAYESTAYPLWILENTAELQHRLGGWFHLQKKVAYLPIPASDNTVKIDIVKSTLEVMK